MTLRKRDKPKNIDHLNHFNIITDQHSVQNDDNKQKKQCIPVNYFNLERHPRPIIVKIHLVSGDYAIYYANSPLTEDIFDTTASSHDDFFYKILKNKLTLHKKSSMHTSYIKKFDHNGFFFKQSKHLAAFDKEGYYCTIDECYNKIVEATVLIRTYELSDNNDPISAEYDSKKILGMRIILTRVQVI